MIRAGLALLLLAALLRADDALVRLPPVAHAGAPPARPRVTIHLTSEGEVRVEAAELHFGDEALKKTMKVQPGLESVTLDELGTHLDKAKRLYDLVQKVKGGTGYDEVAPGVKASTLHVLVRADEAAPWEHVESLMTICAEQKIYKVHLAARRGPEEVALGLFLPVDRGIQPLPAEPRTEVRVPLVIRADAESAVFAYLDREHEDLGSFREYLRSSRAGVGADATLIGEIRASRRTPVRHVLAALELFRAEGYEHVHAFSVVIPAPESRRRARLPPPETNRVPREVHGSAGFGEFDDEDDPEDPD